MGATFPSPSDIDSTYKIILKSIKPSLNVNDKNSDFIIRGKAFNGLVSGLYGDQKKVNNDTWITSARPDALTLHGQDLDLLQQPATKATGTGVQLIGTDGTVVNAGDLTFLCIATNVLYTNTNGGTVSGGFLTVPVQCLITGQIGNIAEATYTVGDLVVVSPPSGITANVNLLSDIANGAEIESTDSYRARLLSRVQAAPAGGNETDYPAFAFAADPSVRSAFIKRFARGLGTVGVYITTGTTDVDTAVTNGTSIVRIPSSGLLAIVQAYYDAHVPLTDCPTVYAPTELDVNATVNVALASGLTLTSVPSDPVYNPLNLNCLQLIQREVGRVLYKLPVGGRQIPGFSTGFVTASDIEEGLDIWLSAVIDPNTGGYIGNIPILADRQCQPLDSPNENLPVAQNQLATPGTITVVLGV